MQSKEQRDILLEHYIRAKLANKRIALGQNFVALFKGKEETFKISDIDGTSVNEGKISYDIKKEEEKGKTQTLKIFIGESKGKVFVATLTAIGVEKLNEEEISFWNHIEKTLKIN